MRRPGTPNRARRQALLARARQDVGAAQSALLVVLGHRLGLYRALAEGGRLTADELAARAQAEPRYVREWLVNQASSGYVNYDGESGRFFLDDEQAEAMAGAGADGLIGAFRMAAGLAASLARVEDAFRTGQGIPAAAYASDVTDGVSDMAEARAAGPLLGSWIPALAGVREALTAGGAFADVGCGTGAITLALARAFPSAHGVGVDLDPGAIACARARADREGLSGRLRFVGGAGVVVPDGSYDLVVCCGVLHEIADPAAVARRIRTVLARDGVWLVVEPAGRERVEDLMDPAGRLLSSVSALFCLPTSRASGDGWGAGALVSPEATERILRAGGFTRVRRLAEDGLEVALEARP